MADTCVSTPTLTRTDVGTSQSQSTTFSASTTTAPGSIETIVVRTCDANVPSGVSTSCIPVVTTSYITHPGDETVVTVPVVVPVDYPVTNIVTLWGSSCSSIYSPPPVITTPTSTPPPYTPPPVVTTPTSTPPYTPPPAITTSTSTPPPYTPPYITTSTSTSWSVYTPPPTTITSSSIITTNGSTFVGYFTSTSTSGPSSMPVPQTGATDTSVQQKKANNIGPIVGGVVGGIVALLLLGFITWKLINKQPKFDNVINNDHYHNKITRDPDPKPYDYNPVGQQAMDPATMSPQMNAQGLDGQGYNNVGPQPSQAPPHHLRNPSLTPLLAAVGVAAVGSGAASLSTTSRPSTSQTSTSNLQPVRPMVTQTGQGTMQNWGPNQSYGATNTQGGYNAQGLASSSGQASGSVPTSSLAPNTNVGTTGSVSSGAGSSTGPYTPPIFPIVAGNVRNNRQQQYEDPFNRTSSTVSTQEQRILQVTNADPFSSYDSGSIYDPNVYYAEGSSSSSSAAAGSSSLARPSGASSASAFVMDGKGRQHNTSEKVPIVHLDGGLYEQPVRRMGVTSQPLGAAPPAYTE